MTTAPAGHLPQTRILITSGDGSTARPAKQPHGSPAIPITPYCAMCWKNRQSGALPDARYIDIYDVRSARNMSCTGLFSPSKRLPCWRDTGVVQDRGWAGGDPQSFELTVSGRTGSRVEGFECDE